MCRQTALTVVTILALTGLPVNVADDLDAMPSLDYKPQPPELSTAGGVEEQPRGAEQNLSTQAQATDHMNDAEGFELASCNGLSDTKCALTRLSETLYKGGHSECQGMQDIVLQLRKDSDAICPEIQQEFARGGPLNAHFGQSSVELCGYTIPQDICGQTSSAPNDLDNLSNNASDEVSRFPLVHGVPTSHWPTHLYQAQPSNSSFFKPGLPCNT